MDKRRNMQGPHNVHQPHARYPKSKKAERKSCILTKFIYITFCRDRQRDRKQSSAVHRTRGTILHFGCTGGDLTIHVHLSQPGTMWSKGWISLDVHHPIIRGEWHKKLSSACTNWAVAAALIGEKRRRKRFQLRRSTKYPRSRSPCDSALFFQTELLRAAQSIWKAQFKTSRTGWEWNTGLYV